MLLEFLIGFCASAMLLTYGLAEKAVDEPQKPFALAFNNLMSNIGVAVFQVLIGVILDLVWNGTYVNGKIFYTGHDYRIALLVIPLVFIISAIVCLFVRVK